MVMHHVEPLLAPLIQRCSIGTLTFLSCVDDYVLYLQCSASPNPNPKSCPICMYVPHPGSITLTITFTLTLTVLTAPANLAHDPNQNRHV